MIICFINNFIKKFYVNFITETIESGAFTGPFITTNVSLTSILRLLSFESPKIVASLIALPKPDNFNLPSLGQSNTWI